MTSAQKKGTNINAFESLNLSHKRTRDRVRQCLAVIAAKPATERFLRIELDYACGQPNKPLAQTLRQCFLQLGSYSPKSNEWKEYVANPQAVAALSALLEAYDAAQAEEDGLRQLLIAKGLKEGTRTFDVMVVEQLRLLRSGKKGQT
jgi:hypothetical protein